MTAVERLNELRKVTGFVHILAARCQDDFEVAQVLPDGRVLAPTCAADDYERLTIAEDLLRQVLDQN